MGYALSWAALKNGTLEKICSAYNLRPTGEREKFPKSKVVAAEIPAGWHLILWNRKEVNDRALANLSAQGEVVSCYVEDHVMFSSASGWAYGKQIWKVFHNCDKGTDHLEVEGDAPAALADIRKRLTEKQEAAGGEKADVDFIYDIPVELAKTLTGFRHDENTQGAGGDAYQVLEAAVGGKKSLVARIATMFKGSSKSSVLARLVMGIIFLPLLLLATLIGFPIGWAGKWVQKFRDRQFLQRMALTGRTVEWCDVQRELSQGRGSLILESPFPKEPRRVWWTPDTLAKESPFPYASSKEKERTGFEIEFAPFNKWCNENYTNPGSGRAMLVKFDLKMLRQHLEGYEYVKFFRLRSAKS